MLAFCKNNNNKHIFKNVIIYLFLQSRSTPYITDTATPEVGSISQGPSHTCV